MQFDVGDSVRTESESTDRPPRHGTVEEVLRSGDRLRYRIRWEDGQESIYTPSSGALMREPAAMET